MFKDAVGREILVGDKVVFYQPMSKVNGRTGRRSSGVYDNNAMGEKAKSLQEAKVLELKEKPTKANPERLICIVERVNGEVLTLERFDRIAVIGRV